MTGRTDLRHCEKGATFVTVRSGENSGGTPLKAQRLSPDVLAAQSSQGLTPPPAVPCGQP
jgi:hypothetical protein